MTATEYCNLASCCPEKKMIYCEKVSRYLKNNTYKVFCHLSSSYSRYLRAMLSLGGYVKCSPIFKYLLITSVLQVSGGSIMPESMPSSDSQG